MANERIKKELKEAHMAQWRLADLLGVSDQTIQRNLRHELSQGETERIIKVIKEGKKEEK